MFFEAGVHVQDAFVASAWSGRDDAAEFMLLRGADVDTVSESNTALMAAAEQGRNSTVVTERAYACSYYSSEQVYTKRLLYVRTSVFWLCSFGCTGYPATICAVPADTC